VLAVAFSQLDAVVVLVVLSMLGSVILDLSGSQELGLSKLQLTVTAVVTVSQVCSVRGGGGRITELKSD
jgi:hypothetical protein